MKNFQKNRKKILEKHFDLLKQLVTDLRSRGTTIVFFELPVNNKLVNLQTPEIIRQKFHDYFPDDKYGFIDLPENYLEYITIDGGHLTNEEAGEYMIYFNAKWKEILSKTSDTN